ncbi:sugar phosphate isomerase/epimerase family protein [Listeria costaricensis]|uniref:sugar phosphate isomerase/epimerase family protein n=1 Tax=Listeria costaricensis TaxID=2026604 RepID=UPI000C06A810|nr:sugar phosphate isomerase/epimerase [Listeria costaricensis]
MKLGFLTGCLDMPLIEKLDYAAERGFETVEVSCWPKVNERDYAGSDIDVVNFAQEDADQLLAEMEARGLEISSLAYYDNMLHPDPACRAGYHAHLKAVILAAEKLHVELVGTFVGKNQELSLEENFDLFEEIFSELVSFAEAHHVKLMIENCPMPGWEKDGLPATISYAPEFWTEMFRRVPSASFGLNFDPSHLHWLQIDYLDCLDKFHERIFHVHAKDCQLDHSLVAYYGIFGKKLHREHPEDLGWFTPKIPGLGDISWPIFIERLRQIGYDGYLSIEHEDRMFEGTNDKVIRGLDFSYHHLYPLVKNFQESSDR